MISHPSWIYYTSSVYLLCSANLVQLAGSMNSKCVLLDNCYQLSSRCYKTYEFKPLQSDSSQKLQTMCPSLGEISGKSSQLPCCSDDSIQLMYNIYKEIEEQSSRTACSVNYMQILCQIACSPDQADFIRLVKPRNRTQRRLEVQVEYFISTEFSDKVYESCQNLNIFKSTTVRFGRLRGGDVCDKALWFDSIANDIRLLFFYSTKIVINYHNSDPLVIGNKTYHPLRIQADSRHEIGVEREELQQSKNCEPALNSSSLPVEKSHSKSASAFIIGTIIVICATLIAFYIINLNRWNFLRK